MADIYRPLKIYNGSAWDYIYLDIMESCIKGGWTQSLGAKSYRKFPGGVILQWGWYDTGGAQSLEITFPIAFPTAVRGLVVTASNNNLDYAIASATSTNNNGTKFTIHTKSRSGWWIALGN
ncbi:hypothetical protein [Eubacterium sp.]|uniref:gp53-like domain-containing protein n=1 Tax=Eubacterium sp. TaxID=142586 RepID=UPI0026DFADAE|nr:hypothetical protein [Eubacterium sp.]MDO5434131.1 hypothetical protein [Eubacterium sp.]